MRQQDIQELWEKSAAFHGHQCPGLAIGVRAAYEAGILLDVGFSENEETVCITENDACGVDGIQVVLGCSAGKGNLIFRICGKHAYSFYNRKTGQSVRLVLKDFPKTGTREERMQFLLQAPMDVIFEIKTPNDEIPEVARIFASVTCEVCGESTAEPYVRLENGRKVCIDCSHPYEKMRRTI